MSSVKTLDVAFEYVSKVSLPVVKGVTSLVTSISIMVGALTIILRMSPLVIKYIAKQALPRFTIAVTSFVTSVATIFRPPFYSKLPRLLFRLVIRPSKPSATLISSPLVLTVKRSAVDVKKPFVSLMLVVRPAKPSPSIVASNYPSVGVRKSP